MQAAGSAPVTLPHSRRAGQKTRIAASFFFSGVKSIFHETASAFPAPWTFRVSQTHGAAWPSREPIRAAHDCEHMGNMSLVINWKQEPFFLLSLRLLLFLLLLFLLLLHLLLLILLLFLICLLLLHFIFPSGQIIAGGGLSCSLNLQRVCAHASERLSISCTRAPPPSSPPRAPPPRTYFLHVSLCVCNFLPCLFAVRNMGNWGERKKRKEKRRMSH